jgi:adenylate cyclase
MKLVLHGSPWRLRFGALVVALLLISLIQWLAPGLLSLAENAVGDYTWRAGASTTMERRVVVVDIDEASLAKVGAWPWSRQTMVKLAERLEAAGAAVQVYDVLFDSSREGDADLAEVWSKLPVVVGQIFSLDPATTPQVGMVGGALASGGCPPFAPLSRGHVANSPTILSPHLAVGHLTPRVQADGVVRKVPAIVCHDGRSYPSLALAALWRAAQAVNGPQIAADWTWHTAADATAGFNPLAPSNWLSSPSLPGVVVPVDDQGDIRVPFRYDRRAFVSLPAHAVLSGTVDLSPLRGTIALVGATAFGIGDVTATPLSSVASGVEVHAQAIAGLLDNRLVVAPQGRVGLQMAAGLGIALVLLAVAVRQQGAPVKRLPIAGATLAVVCYFSAAWAQLSADLWLPWLAPALFALVASTSLATAEHAITRTQRERLSAHLGAYLPGPVAERLALTDPSGSLQVDQRVVTVLVADIRNFSAFAAHRPPQETAALLHAFYCIAVDVVEQHDGVVENVVGDSIMAVWNAYTPCDDQQQQALAAAKELVRATRVLLAHPEAMPRNHPVQPLALGVGLESGTAVVGSFGPARRRAHVALGEPVSVASRLQQMTQDLSMPVLIGQQLAQALPADASLALGDYLLEGLSKQYTLFAPADWVELIPSEQLWAGATSVDALSDDGPDTWSISASGSPVPAYASGPLRDA